MLESDRIISANNKDQQDVKLDKALRPQQFSEYIGQEDILDLLDIAVQAAHISNECLDHILIFGPPGLGKTTLANIIANEMNVRLVSSSGPVLEKSVDLAAILSGLETNDILFIDEIHRLPPKVEEILYSAMEDYHIDIMLGEGAGATSMRYPVKPFTLVGATTKAGSLTSPLLSRFGHNFRLNFYTVEQLQQIILRSAQKLKTKIEDAAAYEIAKRSRGTPRITNMLLRRVRDFALVKNNGVINLEIANDALNKLDIDKEGLDYWDRKFLVTLIYNFPQSTAGLETLSASLGEDKNTIEDVIEPYLLQQGYINRTPRGRVATQKAIDYFKDANLNDYY